MRQKQFASEADLAEHVVQYLEDQHWDVYQEVQPKSFGPTADIVATQKGLIWIVECKLSFGLSVIEQAYNWLGRAHYVSVAVPYSSNDKMAVLTIRQFGIGHLSVVDYGDHFRAEERSEPRFNRKARAGSLLKALTPERKTFARAGNSNGLRWTAFQQTCFNVRQAVEQKPGICMKEMVETVKTHYRTASTARACLRHWIDEGRVEGVRMERDGNQLRLYPTQGLGL